MLNFESEENKSFNHIHKHDIAKTVIGNSLNLNIKKCDSEIRADIVVEERKSIRLWGQVKNCDGIGVANVLVKLLKILYVKGRIIYQSIASTISDDDGFYQFDLVCPITEDATYKILVGKAAGSKNERTAPIIDELGSLYEDNFCSTIEKKSYESYESNSQYPKSDNITKHNKY